MKSQQNSTEFYQVLGQLFYAIAAADKTVRPEERDLLKKIVQSDWIPLDDTAGQIEEAFNHSEENSLLVKQCLLTFKIFKEKNENLFTPEIKNLIRKTARTITLAVANFNKSESVILSQLHFILAEKETNEKRSRK